MKALGGILLVVGWLWVALAFISGLGVGIYSLSALNLAFGVSAWAGFVVWMKMFIGGFASLIVGFVLAAIGK